MVKRSGGDSLPSSDLPPKRKSRTVVKSAFVSVENFDLPLISTTAGSHIHSIRLEPDRPYTVGRSRRYCDFLFDNRLVSKRHCQILYDSTDRKIYVVDGVLSSSRFSSVVNEFRKRVLFSDKLEKEKEEEVIIESHLGAQASLNGVFVNGVRIGRGMVRELFTGDEVSLVCVNEGDCSLRIRIGFVVQGIVIKEEVVSASDEAGLERAHLFGTMTLSEHSQGTTSTGKRNKRVFAFPVNGTTDYDSFKLQHCDIVRRASFLSSQCRYILRADDPISYIRQCAISHCTIEGMFSSGTGFPCFTSCNLNRFPVSDEVKLKSVVPVLGKGKVMCDKRAGLVQSDSATVQSEQVVALEAGCGLVDLCVRRDQICQESSVGVASENAIAVDNSKIKSLSCVGEEDATCLNGEVEHNRVLKVVSPPGKNFFLNRLEFLDHGLPGDECVISLPELLYPVESISQIFIATFTSDILWFLSYCEIPSLLPVTIACHNAERCWSTSSDSRALVPYRDYPNLVVVFPPFPEAIAFGQDHKKQGIACHHPKLLVLQREDSIRVVITSANLVAKQWKSVTNTVWWQDFPRASAPDYSSLFVQAPDGEINQDARSDFAAQLASFMASLVIGVPSQAHWIVELTKYDFGGAVGHLVASVPGIHSCRRSYAVESMYIDDHYLGMKFLGSVEASVVGLSHLFHNATHSNGTQLKELANYFKKSRDNAYGMLEIVLRRNINVPADVNAVSVLVPNPNKSSDGDCIQLGFLPRNIAKWVSPLWDVGFFSFAGYIFRDEALGVAFGGNTKKVQLILHVLQGPCFSDIPKMMRPVQAIALSSLIASIQRCRGIWRLREVLGQYNWPEPQESDFIYGASSIGSLVNPQFLASFSAAAGKRSLRLFESEESDPEWGCWSVSQELKNPSLRIIFPTIERVKNACNGILPSRSILCFSEKTWQRLKHVNILHDAIPQPHSRVGHPMHVKVARRRFESRTDVSSCGWVYCGSHNFSAAAWGRTIANTKAKNPEKANSSMGSRLHICNYELGIIFIFRPAENRSSISESSSNKCTSLDDVVLPFVVPAPKYRPGDRPATARAMKEASFELAARNRFKAAEVDYTEEMMEESSDEEDDVIDTTECVVEKEEEKEEEKAYAEMLWSQVDSSQSC